MASLGTMKPQMLRQIASQPAVSPIQIKTIIEKYDDVTPEDFRGVISDMMLEELYDLCRNPEEKSLWEKIENAPTATPSQIQETQRLVVNYISRYPDGPKSSQAKLKEEGLRNLLTTTLKEEERQRKAEAERVAWDNLKSKRHPQSGLYDYDDLRKYKNDNPATAHKDELDNMMWDVTAADKTKYKLNRYLQDWPMGLHANEARQALDDIDAWERIQQSSNLEDLNRLRFDSSSPYKDKAEQLYQQERQRKIQELKEKPSEFSKYDIFSLIDSHIISKDDLIANGVVTEQSWAAMQIDRNTFPNLQLLMNATPEIKAQNDCTDIYLFGTPGTGKTCLLMGLAHADGSVDEKGQTYTINMKINGGRYASALQQYVKAGITPGRTSGSYISTIHANVSERTKKGKLIDHPINFVEMSGEEFAIRISDGDAVAFEDMGTGATSLLQNSNRKVFFIIVDSGDDKVRFEYDRDITDNEGNIIRQDHIVTFISQLDILNKFMGLLDQPENRQIMEKVDAIHFIVTKSDRLGSHGERKQNARDLLIERYSGPVQRLKLYCRNSKRINATSGFNPQVFTFSLGNFYVGDVFTFDKTETMEIVEAIRAMTSGKKERTFLDILRDKIG